MCLIIYREQVDITLNDYVNLMIDLNDMFNIV